MNINLKVERLKRGKDRILPQDKLANQAIFGALPPERVEELAEAEIQGSDEGDYSDDE